MGDGSAQGSGGELYARASIDESASYGIVSIYIVLYTVCKASRPRLQLANEANSLGRADIQKNHSETNASSFPRRRESITKPKICKAAALGA